MQLRADQDLGRKHRLLIVLDKFSQGFPYPPIFIEVPREFASSHQHHLQLNHRNCNHPYDRCILMLKFQPLEYHEISPYLSWQWSQHRMHLFLFHLKFLVVNFDYPIPEPILQLFHFLLTWSHSFVLTIPEPMNKADDFEVNEHLFSCWIHSYFYFKTMSYLRELLTFSSSNSINQNFLEYVS